MSQNTKIEWCDHTFNPWTGCTKVSPGCDHCYAEGWSKRAGDKVGKWGPGAPRVRTTPANWAKPIAWNKQPYWQCPCGWRGTEREMTPWDDGFGAWSSCPACHSGAFSPTRARVFCASLADVFDNEVPPEWRYDLFKLIAETPELDWLLLTKRIGNARTMIASSTATVEHNNPQIKPWTTAEPWPNVWIGATITSQAEADRDIPKLAAVPAKVRFLSMEPLLGPVNLRLVTKTWAPGCCNHCCNGDRCDDPSHYDRKHCPHCHGTGGQPIKWVIVGGESGPGARPMHPDWARSLRDQCAAACVPFLFKQWGNWRAAAWFDGPDADRDEGDDFVDLDRVDHLFLSADGRTWDTNGGRLMYPPLPLGHWCLMVNEGKKAAGRLLEGIEHNAFPKANP